jgi:hypothetical protein
LVQFDTNSLKFQNQDHKELEKMKKYKSIFEEKEKLIEIALVGKTKGLEVQVCTDTKPMHFHLVKKDKYQARIKIPKELPSEKE